MTNPFEILEARLSNIENLLLDLKHNSKEPILQRAAEELLTVKQAAELLKLSVPTIYGYVQRQEIPVSKRGKRLYFSKQELLDWVKEGRKKTLSEIEEQANSRIRRNSL